MWRTFFLAIAVSLCILGAECLVVQKAVLAKQVPAPAAEPSPYDYLDPLLAAPNTPQMIHPEVHPPEWAPWSLLSSGVIVMLYALSLNRSG